MSRVRAVVAAVAVAVLAIGCAGADPADSTGSGTDGDVSATSGAVSTANAAGDGHGVSGTTVAQATESTESTDVSDVGTAVVDGVTPDGFTTVGAVITSAEGEVCEVCLWLADTADERGRGLMGVTDLGDADGMVFRFDEPTQGAFYMFQTPTPLSIAWFAEDGSWVGQADMAPCVDGRSGDCPLYGPDEPYVLALEVFGGGLDALGATSGSRLELVEGSESDVCPPG